MKIYMGDIALEAIAGTEIQIAIASTGGVEKEFKAKAAALQLKNIDFIGFVNDEDKQIKKSRWLG